MIYTCYTPKTVFTHIYHVYIYNFIIISSTISLTASLKVHQNDRTKLLTLLSCYHRLFIRIGGKNVMILITASHYFRQYVRAFSFVYDSPVIFHCSLLVHALQLYFSCSLSQSLVILFFSLLLVLSSISFLSIHLFPLCTIVPQYNYLCLTSSSSVYACVTFGFDWFI
jgi:hypothetical protein